MTLGKILRYTCSAILFFVIYAIASLLVNLFVLFINIYIFPSGGLARVILPYFAAYLAGTFGVMVALGLVSSLFSTVRLRPVVWSFAIVAGFFWLIAILGIFVGNIDEGITVMATQTISALFWAFKESKESPNARYGEKEKIIL